MIPATRPAKRRDDVRLLAVDTARRGLFDATVNDLPELLRPGDVVVVNDAATLPASLPGRVGEHSVELRLLGAPLPPQAGSGAWHQGPAGDASSLSPRKRGKGWGGGPTTWNAVLFGAGDWRQDTDARPAPPVVRPRDSIALAPLTAEVVAVSPISPRLLRIRFDKVGAELFAALYRQGAPVQYAYQERPLNLWSVQTTYGAQPWAAEMPSAGRPLTWATLIALRRRGIALASLTHAAGLSATGDPALDAALPLPERYHIPATTVEAIARSRRVIAVGTTVVRALEGNARTHGHLHPGAGTTDLLLGPGSRLRVVDGILTGMHNRGESHFRLLGAFGDRGSLEASWRYAVRAGYRCHEFGDVSLVLPDINRPEHRPWISFSATDSKAPRTAASTAPCATPASMSSPLTSRA